MWTLIVVYFPAHLFSITDAESRLQNKNSGLFFLFLPGWSIRIKEGWEERVGCTPKHSVNLGCTGQWLEGWGSGCYTWMM